MGLFLFNAAQLPVVIIWQLYPYQMPSPALFFINLSTNTLSVNVK